MTLQTFIEWFTEGAIVLLAILTLRQWQRWRDRSSLDIVFVFGTLAALTIVESVLGLAHIQARWIQPFGITVLLAHPYLLLRVVSHFRPVSIFIRRLAPASLFILLVALWVPVRPLQTVVMAPFAFAYFVLLLAYVAFAFRERARAAGGVTHWRMLHAGWGAALFALVFILEGVIFLVPATQTEAVRWARRSITTLRSRRRRGSGGSGSPRSSMNFSLKRQPDRRTPRPTKSSADFVPSSCQRWARGAPRWASRIRRTGI